MKYAIACTCLCLLLSCINSHKTLKDPRDKQRYSVKKFGKQLWMTADLQYRPVDDNGFWIYKDSAAAYGAYYNQEAAKKACPPGWHLPSKAEWLKLMGFLSASKNKTAGVKVLLDDILAGGKKGTGFSLGGLYNAERKVFAGADIMGYYWTSTDTLWNSSDTAMMKYNGRKFAGTHIYPVAVDSGHIEPTFLPASHFGLLCRCVKDKS
ncbi:MAG TPA: FISUMP domain-containing protein [Chitinophagaceae bacterium]|nr:FISUMP domain-containing protein [Chitinophagaceae bacterium]